MTTLSMMEPRQRPRERMRTSGAAALSEAELIALVLRTGRRGRGAVSEAHELLNAAGGLQGVARLSVAELEARPGVGPAKATALTAALELGRRLAREEMAAAPSLDRPEAAGAYLVASLRGHRQEVFGVLSLDVRHRFIAEHQLSIGTRRQAPVEPSELFRRALMDDAASVILFHNHPSGHAEPSLEDLDLTRRLAKGGRSVGIDVLDHLIVAGSTWTSLRSRRPDLFDVG